LLWIVFAYVAWGLVVRHRHFDAFAATANGDTMYSVVTRSGALDVIDSTLKYSRPESVLEAAGFQLFDVNTRAEIIELQ
jgi:hypothetical protein